MSGVPAAAALALLAAVIAVNWAFVVRVLPEFERYKPVPMFSRVLEERLQPGDVVAHYQVSLPSMAYYLRRHVDQDFDDPPFVQAILSARTSTPSSPMTTTPRWRRTSARAPAS